MRNIFFIVGASATGKSDLALELAKQTKSVIVNCDSQQVYRGLNIGTAKPSLQVRSEVPHFFYDIADPGDQYTAGEYRRDILKFLDQSEYNSFVFVGGSGFYVQSLFTQMYSVGKANPDIREKVLSDFNENGLGKLFEELKAVDQDYANKIGPNDKYRLLRSVEILRATGKTPTELRSELANETNPLLERGFVVKKFGLYLDRDQLRLKVKQRAQNMIKEGLIEETKTFLDKDLGSWRPLNSVGYKEVRDWLAGRLAEEDLVEKITTSTMQLCKRQHTWFKRDKEITWLDSASSLDSSKLLL